MMRIIVIVLVLKISHCFSQTDGTFLIYSTHTKDCLGDSLQNVIACNPLSLGQQFRWTSGRRIFNVGNKKCLAVGRSSVGSNLLWSTCDADSSMQKWDCYSDFLFGLKNESLYLSVQGTKQVKLSNNPGDKGKWTVYGTVDSVCSRPYEELYTHGGNAFGRPCHFPFRYKTKWYTECTHNDRDYLWCAIESEYELNELWGYCPIENTEIWNKDPKTGIYYQVTERSVLTWHQARKSCQQQGGDLLSITKPHEQTFRSELISHSDVQLWIGLNSLDAASGWRWVNGQPLRYLKWLSGQPSSQPGHNCAVANNDYGTDWSTAICSEKHGYICQKGLPTPTIPPVVDKGFCQSPWIPYSGHCYLLNREKTTWVEARDACLREGGDLLSILSVEEQSFVISRLGYFNTDELWLGFSDLTSPMLFEWSDHSSVPFTWWEESEPSPADEEDCVVMRGEEGKWANEICQRQCGYICKKKTNSNPSVNDTVVTSPDCKPGWVRFGSYCYTTGSETKTFEEAKQMCEEKGSYLVDITNRVENAFLVSLVGARTEKHFWIGLSIRKDQHTFEWTNTNKVAFTHFNAGMPGGKKGCVAMTTGMLAGLWDVLNCSNKEKYICKHMAEGVTTTPPTFTTTAPKCAMGWYPLPNRDLCFKLFDPGYEHVKSWPESLAFCRELGGDLLSIHSDDDFSASPAFSTEAWIGYSIRDPSAGYMWSDGSSSSYENWQTGQPDNFNNVENCVKAHFHWRLRYNGQWSDLHCEDRKAWFCEIQKGVTPKEVKIQSRRVTPKEVKIQSRTYNTTSDGWIIFKGNQYYIDRGFSMPMAKARSFCKQRHSDLVVINDEEERVFVWHQARYALQDIYIGMYIDMDKSITWMDGSPVVFQAWAANQPAFLNSEENCIKMTQSQGLWESVHCADHKKFVCKRNGTAPMSVTPAPTESPRGCTSDWLHFMGQCYKIGPGLKTWMEARSYCRSLGGDLTSVLTKIQHAFLTLLMDDSTPDLWIGLSDMAIRTYRWTDGSEIHSSRWAKGEPVSHQHMVSACVVMGNMRRAELGKWVTRDCNNTNGFICRRAPDGSVVNPSTTRAPNTFVKIGNSSYLAVEISLTWKDAKLHCEAQGARLASIRDVPALSYATLQAHRCGQPMWIGLNTMETDGYFLWIDNWHLNMESWAYDEPRRENPCVYVNGYGTWQTASCNQTYYSLCKKTTEMAPTVPARYPGVCPDRTDIYPKMKWLSYKASCYAFVTKEQTWNTALRICMTRGAKLLSIEDPMEGTFITNYITLFPADYTYFWMGLFKIHGGHWLWHDDSVVDYTNWDPSENDDSSEDEAVCASISTITTQWSKRHCAKRFPFICKVAKDTKSESKTADTDPAATEPEGHGMYVVGSVLVVIAALGILAGLVYVYHRKSKNQAFSFQGPVFYNQIDPESEGKESNILVNQMEINEQEQVL
ncbi:macrophage mannose receptor 1-like isoform X2 [Brachyhypopomus gauderio]|uniref:macrophage mannose receptor 1-like isoform X2 n=1 Tax=Brachyhypopomus gauderio TaxID=698409 RepID=UPI004041FAC4